MSRRVARPGVREGYDRWSEDYDHTPNPLVALDRQHTMALLQPRPLEWILDAGCGTGAHLRGMVAAGSRPVGLDLSRGMLRVARRSNPRVPLAQADLDSDLPVAPARFDALLCSLVSEHLQRLGGFLREGFEVLRRGGRLVLSAFHPELAASGVEANFRRGEREYRLGAERYTVYDYLNRIWDAGFEDLRWTEHEPGTELIERLPAAVKYAGHPVMLTITASRPMTDRGAQPPIMSAKFRE